MPTEGAGRFGQVVVEETVDARILTSTVNRYRRRLFPVSADVRASITRDAVVVVALNEWVVIVGGFVADA